MAQNLKMFVKFVYLNLSIRDFSQYLH